MKKDKIKVIQVFYVCMNGISRDRYINIPSNTHLPEELLIENEFSSNPLLKNSKILYYVNKEI